MGRHTLFDGQNLGPAAAFGVGGAAKAGFRGGVGGQAVAQSLGQEISARLR